jgi:hypothetical protein
MAILPQYRPSKSAHAVRKVRDITNLEDSNIKIIFLSKEYAEWQGIITDTNHHQVKPRENRHI